MQPEESKEVSERLNKYLAFHLGISRRKADELIAQKKVTINNTIATIGARVTPSDSILVNSKKLEPKISYTYLALNKPRGYVCSRKKQGSSPTIYSLLPDKYHALKPVGRLDLDSSGLLLLTDDGDFTFSMTHPKFYKLKTYLVTLNKDLAPLHHQMINDYGIQLDDGPSKLQLEKQEEASSKKWIVTMSEGRNRQIRRTFSSIGYTVVKLHRIQFGKYSIDALKSGSYQLVEKRY